MGQRRRFKQATSLQERLISFANEARKKVQSFPPGPQKIELLRKARQADSAARLDKWVNSPGLQPPD